jgi:hypothetical protein
LVSSSSSGGGGSSSVIISAAAVGVALTCQWLMGPCKVNDVELDDGTVRQQQQCCSVIAVGAVYVGLTCQWLK